MTPQEHLDRLIEFIQPPWTNNWWAWAKHRAEELAQEPEFAHLPASLNAERDRIKGAAMSKPVKATDTTTTGSA